MNLLPTARKSPERLHRNELRVALGVPKCDLNIPVYTEAQALLLPLIATQRLLLQCALIRLGETFAGCSLLGKLWSRPLSLFAISFYTLAFFKLEGRSTPKFLWTGPAMA